MLMQEFYAIDNYPIDTDISKKLLEEFVANKRLKKGHICTTFIKMNKGITQIVLNCISK